MEWGSAAACDPIYVCESCLAGRRARTRDPGPDESVDQARFPDIRPPDHRDFRERVSRKIASRGGTDDELSGNLQWVIVSSTIASTGSTAAAADTRPVSDSTSAI